MDDGDAVLGRVVGTPHRDDVAVSAKLAAVWCVHAGQRLDERRLAGAVLSHQSVDLTGQDREIDPVQGQDAGKALVTDRHSSTGVVVS